MMPFSWIEWVRSSSSASSKVLRGLRGLGRKKFDRNFLLAARPRDGAELVSRIADQGRKAAPQTWPRVLLPFSQLSYEFSVQDQAAVSCRSR